MTCDTGEFMGSSVIIVGAGFSGLGLGAMLKKQGVDDFVILERGLAVGGTWRENTYPGVACDVPSQVYSYSFAPNPNWTRVFSRGREIQEYLCHFSDEEDLTSHIRLGTEALQMRWREESGVWECETAGATYSAPALILACGRLSEPKYPPVQSLDSFAGKGSGRYSMHSARWDSEVDLSGKRVAVVGSGASAVQLVPELAKVAEELVVMQRSAPYIVPRNDREYTEPERTMFQRLPETMAEERERWFWQQETVYAQRALLADEASCAREWALKHLHNQVPEGTLREQLTPRYEIGCKRVLLSDEYYPALMLPRVSLIDSAVASIAPGRLIAISGEVIEADVAIFATGFHSQSQPYAERVVGEGGVRLAEEWQGGMYAYNSTSVPGFPNMFVMGGPNASLGHNSAIFMIESQIKYICEAILQLKGDRSRVFRVRRDLAQQYKNKIDSLSAKTVWVGDSCESWYRDKRSGRLTLLWPGSSMQFRDQLAVFDSHAFE